MTQEFNRQTFADAVGEYRFKTKNYPWANVAEHEKAVVKEATRLFGWVSPIEKVAAWRAVFKSV